MTGRSATIKPPIVTAQPVQHTTTGEQMAKLYAVYDHKAEDYVGPIMREQHDAVAVRIFSDVCTEGQIGKHPDDYELRCIGELTHIGVKGEPFTDPHPDTNGKNTATIGTYTVITARQVVTIMEAQANAKQ